MSIEDVIVDSVLTLAGVPSNVVKDIEVDMPEFARLCNAAKLLAPIADEAAPMVKALIPKLLAIGNVSVKDALPMLGDLSPMIDALKPAYAQISAVVTPEIGDAVKVAPAIGELIDFLSKKSRTPSQQIPQDLQS